MSGKALAGASRRSDRKDRRLAPCRSSKHDLSANRGPWTGSRTGGNQAGRFSVKQSRFRGNSAATRRVSPLETQGLSEITTITAELARHVRLQKSTVWFSAIKIKGLAMHTAHVSSLRSALRDYFQDDDSDWSSAAVGQDSSRPDPHIFEHEARAAELLEDDDLEASLIHELLAANIRRAACESN
jgi:hypothetical protein